MITTIENVGLAVSASPVSLEFKVAGPRPLVFSVVPTGANLTGFVVQLKDHPNSAYYNYLGNADWAAGGSVKPILYAGGAWQATSPYLLNGAKGWAHVSLPPYYTIQFVITASGAGTVDLRGGY